MYSKEQVARWKQGKFYSAERKEYLAWQKAGRPAGEDPKPEENAPVQGPSLQGEEGQDSILNFGGATTTEEEPAALGQTSGSVDDIMNFTPGATSETQSGTTEGIAPEGEVRRDAEGEEYQLPESFEWFENTWLGDLVQDSVLYVKQGLAQRRVAGETAEILAGTYDSDDVTEYLEAVQNMNEQEQTAETAEFNRQIEENGGGFFGVLKAAASNPTAAMGIMITSMIAMTTPESLGAGAVVAGTGAAAGSIGGPIGTAIGAILGTPAAIGTMSAVTDATLTFSDYMQTALREKGLEFNEENLNALLQDPETISGLRTAAAARGIAIGVIDALTLKLGTGLSTRLIGKGVGKGTTALAATGVEAVGGGVGETAGQVTEIAAGTREEIDTTEIALESIAEIAGPGTAVQIVKVVKEGAKGEITGNEVKPTGDSKPSADLSTRKPVETVSELQSQGVIRQDVKPEITVNTINRIAVKTVTAGLETEGITIENITPEQIETVIPRIKQEVVSNLQAEGVITEEADIESKDITDLINRVTVEALAEVATAGVEDVSVSPTAEDTVAPEYTPEVKTASEIEAEAVITEEIEIAQRDITAEIEAPRAVEQIVSEIEAEGFQDVDTPVIETAAEVIPQIIIEEVAADNPLSVEAIVEETVNEIQAAGYDLTPQEIEATIPVIQRIAEHTVNEISPEGINLTPLPELVATQLDALAIPTPDKPNFTIGPNDNNVTEEQVVEHVENSSDEALIESNVQSDNQTWQDWIDDKVQRAVVRVNMPENVPNKERVVDLEVGLNRYKGSESVVGKARATEINKRIKNLASGKPEMDGIITEATETQPAKNNSVLGDETFLAVEKPEATVKPERKKKVAPSIEAPQPFRDRKTGKTITPKYRNPNFKSEFDAKLKYDRKKGETPESGSRDQIRRITEGIKRNPPTGNEFIVALGGTSPSNLKLVRQIAEKDGLVVEQHPLNPGEFVISRPGANLGLKTQGRFDGVPFGLKNGVQFFTHKNIDKNRNRGINVAELDNYLTRNKGRVTGSKSGLFQDVHTLNPQDQKVLEDVLRRHFDTVDFFDVKQKRSGKTQTTTFVEFYNKSEVSASIAEAKAQAKANQSFLASALKTLKRAFPKVEVVSTVEGFRKAVRDLTLEGVEIPANSKGFVYAGKVYLNPAAITKDTPFHEFAHLWARSLSIENPVLFNKMYESLKGSEYMRIVDSIPFYNQLKTTDFRAFKEEVIANALGKRAAELVEIPKWRQLLNEFVDWLKYKLKIGAQTGYDGLTMDDFIDIGAKSILTGSTSAFEFLPGPVKESMNIPDTSIVAASIPEGLPEYVNEADVIKGTVNAGRKIGKKERNWKTDPQYRDIINEQILKVADKRVKKEKANTTKKPVEPLAPAMESKYFRGVVEMFAAAKEKHYKTSWYNHTGKVIMDISNERIARSLGKIFQDFESGEVGIQQFYSVVGQRIYPKRPQGMEKGEFKKIQLNAGALVLEVLIEQGVVDLGFSIRDYKQQKKRAKKTKTVIPTDAGYVIDIKNDTLTDGLADAVAIYPSNKPDFKEVYVGDQKPEKTDSFRGPDGLQIISRDNETNRITRESHPEVFNVKDKADSTKYVVDTEYLNFFKKIMTGKNQKVIDKLIKGGSEKSKKAKIDTLLRSILNMERIGEQSFSSAHNFVHNGRLMNTSTDVSHQSSKNVLAAYSFEQKEKLGESGWEWMQVLTQDTYGYSGTGDTRADRLAAAKKNTKKWMEVAADPIANLDYIMDADVPMLFLRHILEMKNALATEGGPTQFESGLPAHMDATTSGIQFLAAITKDRQAAEIANLTNTEKRGDSYSEVVVAFLKELLKTPMPDNAKAVFVEYVGRRKKLDALFTEAVEAATPEAWDAAKQGLADFKAWKEENNNGEVAARMFWFQKQVQKKFRKIFKKPVMTKYYSSTIRGMSDDLYSSFKDIEGFEGIDTHFTTWLAKKANAAADEVFTGPKLVMDQMQQIAAEVAKADQAVTFENPVTGFKIVNDPRKTEKGKVRFRYFGDNEFVKKRNEGGKISSNIVTDTEEKNGRKQKNQIAPLIVHSLDAALVHYIFKNADFPVQTIHDSFATNPANTQKLYKLIRQGFHEITKGDVLLDIMTQIYENAGFADAKKRAKEKFDATQIGGWNPDGLLENQYAFSAGVTDPLVAEKTLALAGLANLSSYSLAEHLVEEQTTEAISHEAKKIAEESKPCK